MKRPVKKRQNNPPKTFSFSEQINRTLLLTLFFVSGYKLTQLLSFHTAKPISLALPGEPLIPFIPQTLFVYLCVYLVFPAAFMLIRKRQDFEKLATAFIVVSLVHFIFFLVMPVHCSLRPDLTYTQEWLLVLVRTFYMMDDTTNCFPSMHVSFAFLSYYGMKKFRPEHAPLFLFLAIAISLSTLTMKQHYILDIFSAYLLVLLAKPLLEKNRYKALSYKMQSVIGWVRGNAYDFKNW